jgi:tetratricopeptide (TPR) repeat protein
MSDDRALRGVAVYNPRLLSRRELVGDFVVRTSVLARVCDDLRQADHGHRPAHRIILGQRGMGKTTLLHRLRYAVEDDPSFGARWIPLVFPEEQYNVDRLSTFWLNCLDALSDAIEGRGEDPGPLDAAIEALPPLEEGTRAERALRLLLDEASSRDARLLLLVDNIDLILERLKDQEWALREALSHEDRLLVIGASARAIESTFTFDAAFYDFFEVEELSGLTQDETHTLLTHLASRSGHPDVAELVRARPERVEPLRVLAGGNPRTLALLFTILAQDADGDVRSDLEQLLDRCTPLYKARFEQLSPQAQKVVHELAVYWHPIGSAALAELCDLPARTVSGQLERLYKDGVIQKVQLGTDAGASNKTGYQVAERFFNIWYLMRASRRVRRKLMWLVEFLRLMHTPEERRHRARAHLTRNEPGVRSVETAMAMAQAIDDPTLRGALEHQGLQKLIATPELRRQLADFIDLDGDDAPLRTRAERLRLLAEGREALIATGIGAGGRSPEEVWDLIGDTDVLSAHDKHRFGVDWAELACDQKHRLVELFKALHDSRAKQLGSTCWGRVRRLFREGYIDARAGNGIVGALEASEAWNDSLTPIALRDDSLSQPWIGLGIMLTNQQRHPEAEAALRQALLLERDDPDVQVLLAWHLHKHGDPAEALTLALRAESQHPQNPEIAQTVACCLLADGRWHEAARRLPTFANAPDAFHDAHWADTIYFFRLAVQKGHASHALAAIDQLELADRWLPLRTALQVLAVGDRGVLLSVAPEVRQPTEVILSQLAERPPTAAPTTRTLAVRSLPRAKSGDNG